METIEQRIKRIIEEFIQVRHANDEEALKLRTKTVPIFVAICKEQQDIDIQRACDWLKNYRQECPGHPEMYIAGIVNDQTIEDFKQAMKGE